MNYEERKLLEHLMCYNVVLDDIKRLEERLERMVYRVTASYSMTGGGGGSYENSKVEALAIRRMEAEREIKIKRSHIDRIDRAIANAGLDQRERDTILCTIKGFSLSSYARQEHIYQSYVYKIRDSAIKKMVKYLSDTQNEFFSR